MRQSSIRILEKLEQGSTDEETRIDRIEIDFVGMDNEVTERMVTTKRSKSNQWTALTSIEDKDNEH